MIALKTILNCCACEITSHIQKLANFLDQKNPKAKLPFFVPPFLPSSPIFWGYFSGKIDFKMEFLDSKKIPVTQGGSF